MTISDEYKRAKAGGRIARSLVEDIIIESTRALRRGNSTLRTVDQLEFNKGLADILDALVVILDNAYKLDYINTKEAKREPYKRRDGEEE